MIYKGYNLWWNDAQNRVMVQIGYHIIGKYKNFGAAKAAVTRVKKRA